MDEAVEKNADIRTQMGTMNIKTPRALWDLVRKRYPKMGLVKVQYKKIRNAPLVKDCAQQCLGRIPMKFNPEHVKHVRLAFMLEPGFEYFFFTEYCRYQVMSDAGTVDCTGLVRGQQQVISERGVPMERTAASIANASVRCADGLSYASALN